MTDVFLTALLPVVMFGLVAVFVFESVKADLRANAHPCVCGHRKGGPPGGHVSPRDWDSNAWIEGAEFKPGQCRECRCRAYSPRG